MKLALLVLALMVSQTACMSQEAKSKAAAEHYNRGMSLGKEGDHDAAVAEFREALRLKPDDPKLHLVLGEALAMTLKAEPDSVIAEYREALRLKPDYAEAHEGICYVLGVKGDIDGAIAECREAIRLKPDDAVAHQTLARVLQDKGDPEGAFTEKLKGLELEGDAFYAKGDYARAIGSYHEAISDRELNAPKGYKVGVSTNKYGGEMDTFGAVHNKLGMALEKKGDLDGAIREFREALHLNMYDADAHSNFGDALEKKGGHDEALVQKHDAEELKLGHDLPPPPLPPPPPPPR
jgi:Flp pilus assembly protein TadD